MKARRWRSASCRVLAVAACRTMFMTGGNNMVGPRSVRVLAVSARAHGPDDSTKSFAAGVRAMGKPKPHWRCRTLGPLGGSTKSGAASSSDDQGRARLHSTGCRNWCRRLRSDGERRPAHLCDRSAVDLSSFQVGEHLVDMILSSSHIQPWRIARRAHQGPRSRRLQATLPVVPRSPLCPCNS
jgi:hypothetical protein